MKKLFFVSLFGLLLAACSGGDGDPDNKPKPDPDEPTRDTEQVWRTKALNAVAELESIAERTNEIVEEMEDLFRIDNLDDRGENTFDIYDDFLDDLYESIEYVELANVIDSWKTKHKLDNYPLTKEQTYNQLIELNNKCLDLFRQTDAYYTEYWPYANFDENYDFYCDTNNELYNDIIESIDNIRAAV